MRRSTTWRLRGPYRLIGRRAREYQLPASCFMSNTATWLHTTAAPSATWNIPSGCKRLAHAGCQRSLAACRTALRSLLLALPGPCGPLRIDALREAPLLLQPPVDVLQPLPVPRLECRHARLLLLQEHTVQHQHQRIRSPHARDGLLGWRRPLRHSTAARAHAVRPSVQRLPVCQELLHERGRFLGKPRGGGSARRLPVRRCGSLPEADLCWCSHSWAAAAVVAIACPLERRPRGRVAWHRGDSAAGGRAAGGSAVRAAPPSCSVAEAWRAAGEARVQLLGHLQHLS